MTPYLHWPDFSFGDAEPDRSRRPSDGRARVVVRLYAGRRVHWRAIFGKDLLGFYSISLHLASLPVQKISSIVNQIAFPAFAEAQRDDAAVTWHMLKGIRLLSFLSFPVLWGHLEHRLGNRMRVARAHWEPAIIPLQVLAFITPLRMVGNIVPTAIDGMGRPDIGVWNLIVANAIMLPSLVVGSNWGLPGLSVAWGCVTPVVFFSNLSRSLPIVNIRIRDMLGAMALPALCALGMYLAVFLARRFLFSNLHGTVQMVAFIAVGAVTYALLTICLNTRGCKEIIGLRKR